MKLRFLVDVNVGLCVVKWLREQGYDAAAVQEIDPFMRDRDIIALAVREDRIIITMDTDFGELIYRAGYRHRGILLLRMPGARKKDKITVMQWILDEYGTLLRDNFCVYSAGRLRIRPGKYVRRRR